MSDIVRGRLGESSIWDLRASRFAFELYGVMKIEAIHHIQLAMPAGVEEDVATIFYEGILGLSRVKKPSHLAARGGCWFETDEVRIHLGVEPEFRPARKAHPALIVFDIESTREHFEEHDVAVNIDEPLPGFDRFYVDDPFGNRIEIS